eukprot:765331-Rhodomonas_salina.3
MCGESCTSYFTLPEKLPSSTTFRLPEKPALFDPRYFVMRTAFNSLCGMVLQLTPGLSLDDDNAVEVRFVIKCSDSNQQQDLLSKLKLTSELKEN